MPSRIAVIGSGSFGTTMAGMLAEGGLDVALWCHRQEVANEILATGHNPSHMTSVDLSSIMVTGDMADALRSAYAVIVALPSFAVAGNAQAIADLLPSGSPVLLLSKGLASDGGFLYGCLADALSDEGRVAVLSGPNHAEELAQGQFAGAVVASTSPGTATFFQKLVSCPHFRLYTSDDPVGVSICGAAKNVVAIACGMARGLGLGSNTQALLMTRGLAETRRLAIVAGGRQTTCLGLAGVGDMDVTCHSEHSRNGAYGEAFARTGISVADYERDNHVVVEGAHAVEPILGLAAEHGVDMPLATVVDDLLRQSYGIEMAVDLLTGRRLRSEF